MDDSGRPIQGDVLPEPARSNDPYSPSHRSWRPRTVLAKRANLPGHIISRFPEIRQARGLPIHCNGFWPACGSRPQRFGNVPWASRASEAIGSRKIRPLNALHQIKRPSRSRVSSVTEEIGFGDRYPGAFHGLDDPIFPIHRVGRGQQFPRRLFAQHVLLSGSGKQEGGVGLRRTRTAERSIHPRNLSVPCLRYSARAATFRRWASRTGPISSLSIILSHYPKDPGSADLN